MSAPSTDCTVKSRRCTACQAAVFLRRPPVSITDMDEDAVRWRKAAVRAVRELRVVRRAWR